MNLEEIKDKFKSISLSHKQIVSFDYGEDYLLATGKGADYLTNKVALYNYTAGTKLSFIVLSTGADAFQGSQIPDYYLTSDTYVGNDTVQPQSVNTVNMDTSSRLSEIALPYSNDNVNKFDISTIAKNFVSTPVPDFSFTGHTTDETTKEKYLKPFILQYGEQYPR